MAFFIKLILTDGRQSCATNSNSSQKVRLTVPCDRRRYREIYILSSHAERSFLSHVGLLVCWSWPLRRSIFDPVAKSMDLTTETIEIEGCVVYLVMDGSFVVDD